MVPTTAATTARSPPGDGRAPRHRRHERAPHDVETAGGVDPLGALQHGQRPLDAEVGPVCTAIQAMAATKVDSRSAGTPEEGGSITGPPGPPATPPQNSPRAASRGQAGDGHDHRPFEVVLGPSTDEARVIDALRPRSPRESHPVVTDRVWRKTQIPKVPAPNPPSSRGRVMMPTTTAQTLLNLATVPRRTLR